MAAGSLGFTHDLIDTIGDACILGGGAVVGYRLFRIAQTRLLWRVRRKLILSYIFIGVVPALLIITFFLLSGLLMFFNVSSYMMQARMRSMIDEIRFMANAAALELDPLASDAAVRATLDRRVTAIEGSYPGLSFAAVPSTPACAGGDSRPDRGSAAAGAWGHLPAPRDMPSWVPCSGFAGLLAVDMVAPGTAAGRQIRLVVRAVARQGGASSPVTVVVDVPVAGDILARFREDSGISLGTITALSPTESSVAPTEVREGGAATQPGAQRAGPSDGTSSRAANARAARNVVLGRPLEWLSLLNYTDWPSGRTGAVMVAISMSIADVYQRVSATPIGRLGDVNFGQLLLFGLAIVAGSFLVIQGVAFAMGLALARSITGSVHALFTGTERVRSGDFTHKIAVRSQDQLGELAESFNSMTASIEGLLEERAEKQRLEQELRIARQIQMSLLPQGPLRVRGLDSSTHCEPAREVGGDYFDFLPLGEQKVGVLIADVAGKGTSAALYMAELKGLVAALSRSCVSPRELLIEANRVISGHLDDRSFITMTYAVIDTAQRTFTYARAGHCPLIYVPAANGDGRARQAQVMVPDGIVLGLKLDSGQMFERTLEEVTFAIQRDDVMLLFTDGITEAMDHRGDCFGETRLSALLERHADASAHEVRERIVREVQAFTGPVAQQDDMTMVVLKVTQ